MRLAFLHIPKSGGISVERAIARAVGGLNICPLYFAHDYDAKSYDDVSGFDLYQGHFDFDFARTLPADYIRTVVVRDPLDQAISMFNHIGSREKHPLHEMIAEGKASFAKLWTDKTLRALHNTMAKYLLGRSRYQAICLSDETQAKRVNSAIGEIRENLGTFDLVGVTSRLNTFVRDLAKATGHQISPPGIENTNKTLLIDRASMTKADIAAFHRATWVDRPVFEMITDEFLN